jgi:hypothetical protein
MIMMMTAMANGAVPNTLYRAFSHCSPRPSAVMMANVTAISMKPVKVRMPGFYHDTVSGFRKKD